ncbi:MAG: type II secretion system major pseudopilin GspG [Desulfurivibrionaceae bacterium]|nr:type II secretion system major pseudopilin GspG [Desulfurivibrionaceae bacterium]
MKNCKECKQSRAANQGFSLLELMAVMVILGLIATIAVPQYYNQVRKAKQQTAKTQIEMLMTAMSSYRLDVGDFPTQNQGLEALINDPGVEGWDGPYLAKKNLPKDPWGRDYKYRNPGQHGDIDIFTLGRDNEEGGDKEDKDIGSWQ